MIYKFFCPSCDKKTEIEMRITEYNDEGLLCDNCGTELERDISDICTSFDTSGISGFCGKCNN